MKVIIAGSRNFNDYKTLCKYCDHILQNQNNIEIVCGMAKGADLLGKKYAEEKKYPLHKFPADWNKYGKSAGYIRNKEMGKNADALICFWDQKSKGTKHMINIAKELKIKYRIFYF